MRQCDLVSAILKDRYGMPPLEGATAVAFAPANIALCKYWGKRDTELNLPVTSSLSIGLGTRGSYIQLARSEAPTDSIVLNGAPVSPSASFYQRCVAYVNLFRRPAAWHFSADIQSTVPVAAGLASSAAGFASLIKGLDALHGWHLDTRALSILARLGSGSACRSLWPGFVEWHKGERPDGLDSYGVPLETRWPSLCVGLLIFNAGEKSLSSREAMQRTVVTSRLYRDWPMRVNEDIQKIRQAIATQDFVLLGETAEANALAMHATLRDAQPSISYGLPETQMFIDKIQRLRAEGLAVYFTQDAGPNLKLLFVQENIASIQACFPSVIPLYPFAEQTP